MTVAGGQSKAKVSGAKCAIWFAVVLFFLGGAKSAHALEAATQSAARLTDTAVTAMDYTVGYLWQQQDEAPSALYGPYVGMDFKQKLYDDFLADISLDLFNTSSTDEGVDLYLERAEASWHGSWLTLSGGRRDVGDFLSPGEYFGSYLTMGERTADMVSATLPFRLFADVPDADASVTAPYNAVSVVYIPNLLSAAKTDLDGQEGVVLGQLRVRFGVAGSSSDLTLNVSRGLQDYFQYSSVSEGGGLDASYAFTYKFAQVWGEYAVQDMSFWDSTQVATAGVRLDIHKITFGLLDSLDGEYQQPLSDDPDNPFTGGYPQDPTQAQTPQGVWFVHLVHKTNARQPTQPARFFYGVALTNSMGDYTLARLREGSISEPVAPGYGAATRVGFLPFVAAAYSCIAVQADAGYEF
ncbi:MAG TPA: hypothetical protein VK914_07890 [bacterium]|nr:hypothetical protein [bacterium]